MGIHVDQVNHKSYFVFRLVNIKYSINARSKFGKIRGIRILENVPGVLVEKKSTPRLSDAIRSITTRIYGNSGKELIDLGHRFIQKVYGVLQ